MVMVMAVMVVMVAMVVIKPALGQLYQKSS
jgi:hypothetical protein